MPPGPARQPASRAQGAPAVGALSNLVESTAVGLIATDRRGHVTFVNAAAVHLLGRDVSATLGKPLDLLVHPEQPENACSSDEKCPLLQAIWSGHTFTNQDDIFTRADGSTLPVSYSSAPIVENGQLVGAAISFQSIAERKRAERYLATQYAVARVLAEARNLAEATPEIIRAVCTTLDWDWGAVWGVDLFTNTLRCVAIWHAPIVQVPAFDALSRATPLPLGVGLPGRIWADGTATWVRDVLHDVNFPREQAAAKEGLHSAFGFPIRSNGQILGVMEFFSPEIRQPDPAVLEMFTAIGSQIGQFMERRRAEEDRAYLLTREQAARAEADAQRARLETVVRSAPAGIIFVDARSGHLTANPLAADLFGHPIIPESGTVQYSGQVRTSDGTTLPLDRLPSNRALKGQTVQDEELLIVQPNGRRIPILISAAPVRGNSGEVTGAVVTFEDISVIKDLERMREEWVSLIAHDLRQPVTVITGYAQFLQRLLTKHAAPQDEQKAVENVLVSARNLDRMVGDLLDASRIETRRLKLEKQSVDFPSLVREVSERATAIMRGHPVRLKVTGEIPRLEVDPGRLEQVLGNLLSNAAKYSYPDTEILIAIERADGEVQISVTDQGVGIAADELPKLFTRFYRTREARGKGVAGLGLGLYITRGLVEAHGGRIWAESIPGKSTTFQFTLPIQGR
ncbi:MAG TPA: ATP-binding protein [Chloroflexota bacterium]|nr:ATP-binding protein [Chloroflexota bacterium]